MNVLLAIILVTMAVSPQKPTEAEQKARMERVRDIYLPSAPHRALERLVGEWEQEAVYADGPAGKKIARGRVTNRAILGGRFIASEGTARFADDGLDLASLLLFGFDGRTREHTAIVLDTFGTYYVTAAGPGSLDSSPLRMRGETAEGGGTKKFEVLLDWVDADTYRTEIVFHKPDSPPIPAVKTTHRRVKTVR